MARTHDRAELELHAGGVERGQADEPLDDGDLALVHDQHRHQLDADEERVQQIGAVEERIVLEADAPSGIDEGLEVLVVVVELVLRTEEQVDELRIGDVRVARLQRGHVVEAAKA